MKYKNNRGNRLINGREKVKDISGRMVKKKDYVERR